MKILYLGTAEIAVPTLRALMDANLVQIVGVVTQPDRPAGRHQELIPSPIKELALKHHLLLLQPEKINTSQSLEQIQALAPDLIVVFAYGQILRKKLLTLPRLGCINIHASLLPRHRGAACIAATILSGDGHAGVTIIQMDEGLDTGNILLQQNITLEASETTGSLHTKLAQLSAPLLLKAIAQMEQNSLNPDKQNESEATYAPKLTKENGQINWTQDSEQIERHIRAMNPWPTAYTWLKEKNSFKMLKIWSAKLAGPTHDNPGEIFNASQQGIWVATGRGSLQITEVQLEGKKRMSAADFLAGHPFGSFAFSQSSL